jgi:hypothetical protein
MTPDESLRGMLAAMLVSPRFLYHEEPPSGPMPRHRVEDVVFPVALHAG